MDVKEKLHEIKIDLILESTKQLFVEKGYENTTMNEVAKNVNISKSTLYTYFPSKEELLIKILIKATKNSHFDYVRAIEEAGTAFEKMTAFAMQLYRCYETQPEFIKLHDAMTHIIRNQEKLSDEAKKELYDTQRKSGDLFREIFQQGMEDGTLNKDLDLKLSMNYFIVSAQSLVILCLESKCYTVNEYTTMIGYMLKGFQADK